MLRPLDIAAKIFHVRHSVRIDSRLRALPEIQLDPTTVELADASPTFAVKMGQDGLTEFPFRALSATLIEGHWIDWREPGVLERSAPLLAGVTLFKDHWTSVDKWCGRVTAARWDAGGSPPGINVMAGLDGVADPKLLRGIEIGAINSVSVGVRFNARVSHPDLWDLDPWAFLRFLGEERDGEVVRFIATEILEYDELSFVSKPADPYARRRSTFAANQSAAKRKETPVSVLNQKLGLPDDADEAAVAAAIAELQANAALAQESIAELRQRTIETAALAFCGVNEPLDEAMRAAIQEAKPSHLKAMLSAFQKKAEARFPAGGRSSVDNAAALRQSAAGNAACIPNVDNLH